jgi:hypothetical protein
MGKRRDWGRNLLPMNVLDLRRIGRHKCGPYHKEQ